ncbi:MAG: hypothetical protein V9G23_13890 [Giesbergeria sp.]
MHQGRDGLGINLGLRIDGRATRITAHARICPHRRRRIMWHRSDGRSVAPRGIHDGLHRNISRRSQRCIDRPTVDDNRAISAVRPPK